jgi:hypothetical protein
LVWRGGDPLRGSVGIRAGDQVAVEAKARANVEALYQARFRDTRVRGPAPDFRAVLVPKASRAFLEVARDLGVGVYTARHCGPWGGSRGVWNHPRKKVVAPRQRWETPRRLWTPPIVSERPAGEPCPSALTEWRVKALELCAVIRARGYCTTADFKRTGISITSWIVSRRHGPWLVRDGEVGRRARYIEGPGGLPDRGFEAERDALEKLIAG